MALTGPGIRSEIIAPMGNLLGAWTTSVTTINGSVSNPTKGASPTVDKLSWRRVGSCMEIVFQFQQNGANAGTAGSGSYLFPIPGGLSIDSNVSAVVLNRTSIMGVAAISTSGNNRMGFVVPGNSTSLVMYQQDTIGNNNLIANGTSDLSDAGTGYGFHIFVPIQGW